MAEQFVNAAVEVISKQKRGCVQYHEKSDAIVLSRHEPRLLDLARMALTQGANPNK